MTPALLYLLIPLAFAQGDPMSREYQTLAGKGYEVERKAVGDLPNGKLVTLLLRKGERRELRVYSALNLQPKLLHMEPGFGKKVALASIHQNGRLPDLFTEGTRVIAYVLTPPGHMTQDLILMKYSTKAGMQNAGRFPFGEFEDIDGDGRLEIVSKDRPLGELLDFSCEDYMKMSPSAFRTKIYTEKGGRFVDASAKYKAFYEKGIREKEGDLSSQDPRTTEDFGGYLGTAVSLYYDYESAGRGQEGWRRLHDLFPVKWSDPGAVKTCFQSVKETLRDKLGVPDSW